MREQRSLALVLGLRDPAEKQLKTDLLKSGSACSFIDSLDVQIQNRQLEIICEHVCLLGQPKFLNQKRFLE